MPSSPTHIRRRTSGHGDDDPDVSDALELERRRIGQEFHDGLGQRLTSISVAANILTEKLAGRGAPEAADARRIVDLVRDAVREARALARGLYPSEVEAQSLERALDDLMSLVRDTTDLSTTIQFDGWEPMVDTGRAHHVYRIVQEAVNNATKHSGGKHIVVSLTARGDHREVYIGDDGRGLVPGPSMFEGLGLGLMRKRAQQLGGTLELESRNDRGLTVRLSFPA